MAASQFVFTSFAVLLLISPLGNWAGSRKVALEAFALECYSCGPAANCSINSLDKVTCGVNFNRCAAIKYTRDMGYGPTSLEERGCLNSLACDPQSDLYTCSLANITGLITSCELACCQDNLCDPSAQTSAPTSASLALVANVNAILLANVLIIFALFHVTHAG